MSFKIFPNNFIYLLSHILNNRYIYIGKVGAINRIIINNVNTGPNLILKNQ